MLVVEESAVNLETIRTISLAMPLNQLILFRQKLFTFAINAKSMVAFLSVVGCCGLFTCGCIGHASVPVVDCTIGLQHAM